MSEPDFGNVGLHCIELASGDYLDLADPHQGSISLGSIAHGLAHTCRFAGQSERFYSVAEHACLVAAKLEGEGAMERVVFAGLHHDDAEAFIGDVTRPLKSLLPGYAKLEARVTREIAEALGLPLLSAQQRAQIKAADDWALSCEAYYLLPSRGKTWFCEGVYDPAVAYDIAFPYDTLGQPPERARELYAHWHNRLVGR